MKLQFSILFALLISFHSFAQKPGNLSEKDKAIAENFRNDYKKKNYKKFDGKITVKDNLVQFDDKIIYYEKINNATLAILKEGLIYPQLLTDFQMNKFLDETTDKNQKRFLKLQKDPRASFDVNNVKLNNLSELTFLSSNAKTKRFKISLRDTRLNTTTTYVFELMNDKAPKGSSLEEFIKGAKLTYIDTI